jgi:hypothetical protein
MTWLTWLALAMVLAVLAAVTGIKPRGTRPVARTELMTVARVVFALMVLLLLYIAYRTRGGS